MGFFSSKPKKSKTTTVKTLPSWLQSAYKDLLAQGQDAASLGITPDELEALGFIQNNVGGYQQYLDQAASGTSQLMQNIAGGPSTEDIEAGMNPFLDLVLNKQRREAEKSYYSGLGQLQDQEQAAGAFGGSRGAVAEMALKDAYDDNLATANESALFNAFENARNQYNLNNQTALQGNQSLANLGLQGQTGTLATGQAMLGAGGYGRGIDQGNLSFLNSIVSPAAQTMVGQESTTVEKAAKGSMFSKILGAATSIAGLASGNPMAMIGGGSNLMSMFGGGGGSSSPMASGMVGGQSFSPLQGGGGITWNPVSRAHGGVIPGYANGGLVDMPDYIRNAPDLTWEEKLRAFEMEQQAASRAEANVPAPAKKPLLSENDPSFSNLLNDILSKAVEPRETSISAVLAAPPRKPAAPTSEAEPSVLNTTKLKHAGSVSPDKMAWIQARNPGLNDVMQAMQGMSPEELNEIFKLDRESSKSLLGFARGDLVPDPSSMSADDEEAYWGNKLFTQELRDKYRPKPVVAKPEEASNPFFTKADAIKAAKKPLDFVDRYLQYHTDVLKEPRPDMTGLTNLEAFMEDAGNTGRKVLSGVNIAAMAPIVGAIQAGKWAGSPAVPEQIAEDVTLDELPVREVGEVITPKGTSIPVEKVATSRAEAKAAPASFRQVEKAVVAQEKLPEEERGMNIPLVMAGIALMTSTGDPFTSIGEGLAAYLGGKEMIKKSKAEEAKAAREAALAERAMGVEEGKLDVMRENLVLDARKIAVEARAAGNKGLTPDQAADNIANIFKARMDAITGSLRGDEQLDMNVLMDEQMKFSVMDAQRNATGQVLAGDVKLTPLQQLMQQVNQGPQKRPVQ